MNREEPPPRASDEAGAKAFALEMRVSGGFYVRSLVRDVANACDSAAYMTSLCRTKQGTFTLADALPEEEWSPQHLVRAMRRSGHADPGRP